MTVTYENRVRALNLVDVDMTQRGGSLQHAIHLRLISYKFH